MSELSIERVLRETEGPVVPDPAFSARLRRDLEDVFAQHRGDERADGTEGMVVMDVSTVSQSKGIDLGRRRWLAAAAAVAVLGVVGGALVLGGDDGDGRPDVTSASATYADPELRTLTVAGTNPYYASSLDGDLWVMGLSGELSRLDRETGLVNETVRLTHSSPMATGAGAVWIGDAVTGEVLRVDPETAEVVATIETGIAIREETIRGVGMPMDMGPLRTFSRLGGLAVVGDAVWVADMDGRVLRIAPEVNEVVQTIETSIQADFVRVDGDHLLVGDHVSRKVVVLNADSGDEVTSFGPIERLAGADLYGGAAYVQDAESGIVTRIDLASGSTTESAPLGKVWTMGGVPVAAPSVAVGRAGVLAEAGDGFHVLDPVSLEELGFFELDGNAGETVIEADGTAWIVRYTVNAVVEVKPA